MVSFRVADVVVADMVCGRYGTDPRYMPRGSWQMALSRLYNNVNHECITIKTNSNPYY